MNVKRNKLEAAIEAAVSEADARIVKDQERHTATVMHDLADVIDRQARQLKRYKAMLAKMKKASPKRASELAEEYRPSFVTMQLKESRSRMQGLVKALELLDGDEEIVRLTARQWEAFSSGGISGLARQFEGRYY